MFQNRPAVRLVLLFAAGILFATWIKLPPLSLFLLLFVLVLLIFVLFWMRRWMTFADFVLYCAILLVGCLLQMLHQSNVHSRELSPRVNDESLIIFGSVDSEPVLQERRLSCIVNVDSMVRQGVMDRNSRRLMIVVRLEKKDLYKNKIDFGIRLELEGTLEPFPFQRNQGEFDYGKYLALNDIQGIVTVMGLEHVHVGDRVQGNSLLTLTYALQQSAYRTIDRLHSPRHASFLKGIIFGYRADIPPDVKQSFLDTGTIHILAVSGSNVAFVAFIFFSVLGFLRLPKKAVGGIAILGLIAYMIVTGSSASVVRATVMAIVFLCGTLLERKADVYNSISVAALLMLSWNTNTLFDVGFQLSFAAVISIVYFYPRLESLIQKIPERFKEIKGVDTVLKLFAVSLAAQCGTVPFTAYYFGRVSIISLVANLPVVPISGLNTFLGAAELMVYPVSPWMAQCYAAVNDFLVWFLLGFVRQAASVPFAYMEALHFTMAFVAGYYLLVICIFNLNVAHLRALLMIGVLVLCNYVLYAGIWQKAHQQMTASVIDVGQGDAVILEFPNGKRLLIDAGPLTQKFDAGERTVVPYLKRQGILQLEYVLITHPHSDHIGGASSILKLLRVDTLVMAVHSTVGREVKDLLEVAASRHTGMKVVRSGNQIQIDSNARVYVLYPDTNHTAEKNQNNSSVVIKVIYGHSSILLVGDAEVPTEQRMVPRYSTFLSSNILKVGHHGSITSSSEEFLKEVSPQTALVSVGIHNKFRHPSPFTIWRMKSHSIDIKRTDKSGAIILESDGTHWIQKEWR
jgi:competence protein ComEC